MTNTSTKHQLKTPSGIEELVYKTMQQAADKKDAAIAEAIEHVLGRPYHGLWEVADRGHWLIVGPSIAPHHCSEIFYFDDRPLLKVVGPYYEESAGIIVSRLFIEKLYEHNDTRED